MANYSAQPVAIVTGSATGIGAACAVRLSRSGYHVALNYTQSQAETEKTALECTGGETILCAADISDDKACRGLVEQTREKWGRLDVLINNAGVLLDYDARLGAIDHDAVAASFAINAFAPLHICECFTEHVLASQLKVIASLSSHLGSIQTIGAGSGYAYAASKAALNALMKGVAGDLAGGGIKVVLFHPGWVRTSMGGPGAAVDPADSVVGMRGIIAGLRPEQSGSFLSYQGDALPW